MGLINGSIWKSTLTGLQYVIVKILFSFNLLICFKYYKLQIFYVKTLSQNAPIPMKKPKSSTCNRFIHYTRKSIRFIKINAVLKSNGNLLYLVYTIQYFVVYIKYSALLNC